MWFPFASLQVPFCNKFLKDFALTLAVSPWPVLGPPAPWPFPAPEEAERPRSPAAVPESEAARTRCLSAPRSCVRSGGPCEGEAEMQTWGWRIKWCHWQPIHRADVTRLAAPAAPSCHLSLPHHRELLRSKNLLKFIISELSALKTQSITPAVQETPKFPRTVELGGSSCKLFCGTHD